jgi:hypothetical protein
MPDRRRGKRRTHTRCRRSSRSSTGCWRCTARRPVCRCRRTRRCYRRSSSSRAPRSTPRRDRCTAGRRRRSRTRCPRSSPCRSPDSPARRWCKPGWRTCRCSTRRSRRTRCRLACTRRSWTTSRRRQPWRRCSRTRPRGRGRRGRRGWQTSRDATSRRGSVRSSPGLTRATGVARRAMPGRSSPAPEETGDRFDLCGWSQAQRPGHGRIVHGHPHGRDPDRETRPWPLLPVSRSDQPHRSLDGSAAWSGTEAKE